MPDSASLICSLAALPKTEQAKLVSRLSNSEVSALVYDWPLWARPAQLAPSGDWRNWLVLAGRGFGKTRTGAEWVRDQIERRGRKRGALVARTASDARDVMVEGESGLLAICPSWNRPIYEPSKRRVVWPNGALVTLYSAEEPDRLRGPQHEFGWCDEIAAWQYLQDTWDMLQFGLRLGDAPQTCITTTPQPRKLLRELKADPTTVVSSGATFDNQANLAPAFLKVMLQKYEGTRLGRQELYAEILDDTPGALWTRRLIDDLRVKAVPCDLIRIVIAIDPAVTSGEDSNDTGIIAAGLGVDYHGYVLRDLTCKLSPAQWARRAVNACRELRADRIVAEVNNGGDLVYNTISTVDPLAPFKAVHASRGKRVRAEPIAALYEQGRIHHVGYFGDLEDQMCNFVPDNFDGSPDRVDALVWALTELFLEPQELEGLAVYDDRVRISPY